MRRLSILMLPFLLLTACAPAAAPSPTAQAQKPAEAAKPAAEAAKPAAEAAKPAAAAPSEFQQMLARAKAGSPKLRGGLTGYDSEVVKELEKRFEKDFGIKIELENEPGHGSREIPVKVLQAMPANIGVVDWVEGGNPSNFVPPMQQGAWKKVPWDVLAERWPNIQELRRMYPDVPGGPNGTTLQDYCMLHTQQVWSLAYNTRNVKPEEVANFKWDDLLTERWKGRVAFDADGLGYKEMALPHGWGLPRTVAFANNLGVNGVKLISGGSNGVVQSVIQGEGDIGWMGMDTAYTQMSRGAPLQFAWPEATASNFLLTCTPQIPANNPDLAMIFFAWRNFEGEWAQAEMGGGGARPFYAPEAEKYPLGKIIKDAGWTPEKNFVGPKSVEEFNLLESNRAAARDSQKNGIQTGKKVPYSWACETNHPACVPG